MTRRTLCALIAAASLVAFAGCGGSDKKSDSGGANGTQTTPATAPATVSTTPSAEGGGGSVAKYKSGVEKATNDFKQSAQAASEQLKGAGSAAQRLKGLDVFKDSVNQAADDFAALDPPASVKAENDRLVTEFRDLAGTVDDVKSAIQKKDTAAAKQALGQLTQSQGKITQTLSTIQSKIGA
jgi:hypothetical protein